LHVDCWMGFLSFIFLFLLLSQKTLTVTKTAISTLTVLSNFIE
jgi:hypothetical protein